MKRRSAAAQPSLPNTPGSTQLRVQPWAILCLLGILMALAFWRVLLAAGIGISLSIQWRQLESLIAWIAMALLLLNEPGAIAPTSLRDRRIGALLAAMLAIAAVLAGIAQALLESEMSSTGSNAPEIIGFSGDALLALCGITLAFRELKRTLALLGGRNNAGAPAGLTLIDLWRFAAVQWGLLMAAAIVYLRVRVSPEDAAGNEEIRRLLFFLPAAGVLPNAMMVGGIAAWDWILRRQNLHTPARLRAWLVALAAINIGAVLLVMRPPWLCIPGGIFALAAVGLYLAGFPAGAWRTTGGKIILAAWMLFAIGIAAAMMDRLLGDPAVASFSGSAWRHLWGTGAVGLWLLGTGLWLVEREAAGKGIRRPALMAAVVFFAGVIVTAAVFLIATQSGASAETLHWLLAGTIPELLALLMIGASLWRIFRRFANATLQMS